MLYHDKYHRPRPIRYNCSSRSMSHSDIDSPNILTFCLTTCIYIISFTCNVTNITPVTDDIYIKYLQYFVQVRLSV